MSLRPDGSGCPSGTEAQIAETETTAHSCDFNCTRARLSRPRWRWLGRRDVAAVWGPATGRIHPSGSPSHPSKPTHSICRREIEQVSPRPLPGSYIRRRPPALYAPRASTIPWVLRFWKTRSQCVHRTPGSEMGEHRASFGALSESWFSRGARPSTTIFPVFTRDTNSVL